ncbi:response regulator [Paenibacillus sp. PK4536]|uniref:Protein-glutamate O-methyltransferase n=2 Tax=Paenibacillus TaxID=44249 RepID=A0A1E3L6K6_9BACL|nr:response regulator [Paenibacillus sp. PK4536]ODP29398.1 Protein-glutamate O-methyltransferase [Paenibacillus nuruki]WIM41054.1 response regulator [Paenibacillus sp. PK4536]CAJ1316587.1 Protein-glutamate O-methyltransferase [Paenibacillus nuruki]
MVYSSEYMTTKNLEILIADDNDINRYVLMEMLRKLGHKVKGARHGKEAVQLAAQHSYDMIFMDLRMPELGGIEAVQQIRSAISENEKQPYIIACSTDLLNVDLLSESKMNAYISKPLRKRVIEEALSDWEDLR